jgi:hypothetical protein
MYVYLCIQTAFRCCLYPKRAALEKITVGQTTKYLHIYCTELCLASSELLTSHPLSTRRVCPPPAPKAGGYTLARRLIFRKTPDIAWIGLLQYNPTTGQTHTGLALRQLNKVLLGSQPFVTKPRISSINPKVRLRFVKLYRIYRGG